MDSGFGQNVVEPPVESRFRNSIEQLERIGESHADRVIAKLADETIIVAPATAKALTFDSEGDARNTYDDLSELRTIECVSRFSRLEDPEGAAMKLPAIANPSSDNSPRHHLDSRIKNRAPGA
jgi:hypothetical protein